MSGYFQLRSWQQNLLFLTRCQDILSCVCGDKAGCILLSLRDIFGRICRDKIFFFFHKMLSISQSFSWQHKQGFSTSCRDIFRPAYSDRTGCVFFFFFTRCRDIFCRIYDDKTWLLSSKKGSSPNPNQTINTVLSQHEIERWKLNLEKCKVEMHEMQDFNINRWSFSMFVI